MTARRHTSLALGRNLVTAGGIPVLWLVLILADTLSLLGLEQSPRRSRGSSKRTPGSPTQSPVRKLRRGYAWFADLRDSHRLEPGSVLYNPSVGRILVLDNAEVAVMENNVCPFQPTIRLHIFSDSEAGSQSAQVRQVKETISAEVRLMRMALARRLSEEDLPYHMIFCNKSHWWAFILHGRSHVSWWKTTCPLSRSWVGVDRGSVESGAFAFRDKRGNEYHSFPPYDRELDDRTNFSWIPGRRIRNMPLPRCFMAPVE